MFDNFPLWPTRAAAGAANVDALYIFLVVLSLAMCAVIFTVILLFAVKFRRRNGVKAEQIEGSLPLELAWSIMPFFVFLVIFGWGAIIFFQERTPPQGASEVYVVAKQWMWKLQHQEGQREINQLHIPVGRDVKLVMTSQDVIHSFYVPAFRIKQDVLPGRYTTVWFRATQPGTYHLFCAEYCGTTHSGMIGDIVVMDPANYEAWLGGSGGSTVPLAETGKALFAQLGCVTCHRADTQGRGPDLVGAYGKPVMLADGRTVMADDNYVRESILIPTAKVVKGFTPIMPVFQGLVSEDQLNALVAYVKSLGDAQGGSAQKTAANTAAQEPKVQ